MKRIAKFEKVSLKRTGKIPLGKRIQRKKLLPSMKKFRFQSVQLPEVQGTISMHRKPLWQNRDRPLRFRQESV